MSRLLPRALLLLALCCAACEGTETGNPDPSTPTDGGAHHGEDGGGIPGMDAGSTSDASTSFDASAEDGGPAPDAAIDAGLYDDGGDSQDEDAGS